MKKTKGKIQKLISMRLSPETIASTKASVRASVSPIHSEERIKLIEKKQKLISMRLSAAGINPAVIRSNQIPHSIHSADDKCDLQTYPRK